MLPRTAASGRPELGFQSLEARHALAANSLPSIVSAVDDFGPIKGALAAGASTNDRTPMLTGVAVAGSAVEVFDGSVRLGRVVASPAGLWSFTTATIQREGSHPFSVRAAAPRGGTSGPFSAVFTLTIDATAPSAVSVSLPGIRNTALASVPFKFSEAITGLKISSFTLSRDGKAVSLTPSSGGAQLTGSGASYVLGNLSTLTASAGNYILTLAPGGVADTAGNALAAGTTVRWTNDLTPPPAPAISSLVDDVGGRTGTIVANGSTDDTTPTLGGTAEANAGLEFFDGQKAIGSVKADSAGKWSFTTTPLSQGVHAIKLRARDAAGNVGPFSNSVNFTVDTVRPSATFAPVAELRKTSLDSVQITFSEAVVGLDVSSFQLTRGGVPVSLAPAVLSGAAKTFSLTNLSGFTADGGDYVLTLTQKAVADAAGNPLASSVTLKWTNDQVAPAAPSITSAVDDSGTVTGSIAVNGSTDDTTPTISGTSEPNASIQVFDGSTPLGTTKASSTGAWRFTPAALGDGRHAFIAQATDQVLNRGPLSTAVSFTIDSKPPVASITSVPASGTYMAGQKLGIQVAFSEPVFVFRGPGVAAPVPGIELVIGSSVRQARYVSGSGSGALRFEYVIVAGDSTANSAGVSISGNLSFPGGSAIRDGVGNAARAALISQSNANEILVDTAGPVGSFSSVESPRTTPISFVEISFNEPTTGVSVSSFALTRDGVPVRFDQAAKGPTLSGEGTSYKLEGLSAFTRLAGNYVLSLQPTGVVDGVGNSVAAEGTPSLSWTNTNSAPVFTSPAKVAVLENTTLVQQLAANDPDFDSFSFSIVDGADKSFFSISPEGVLSFTQPPLFAAPSDLDSDNVYEIVVNVTDAFGNATSQSLSVAINDATRVFDVPDQSGGATKTLIISKNNVSKTVVNVATNPADGKALYAITPSGAVWYASKDQAGFRLSRWEFGRPTKSPENASSNLPLSFPATGWFAGDGSLLFYKQEPPVAPAQGPTQLYRCAPDDKVAAVPDFRQGPLYLTSTAGIFSNEPGKGLLYWSPTTPTTSVYPNADANAIKKFVVSGNGTVAFTVQPQFATQADHKEALLRWSSSTAETRIVLPGVTDFSYSQSVMFVTTIENATEHAFVEGNPDQYLSFGYDLDPKTEQAQRQSSSGPTAQIIGDPGTVNKLPDWVKSPDGQALAPASIISSVVIVNNAASRSFGSGTVLRYGNNLYVLTASHVVENDGKEVLATDLTVNANGKIIRAASFWNRVSFDNADLALIKLSEPLTSDGLGKQITGADLPMGNVWPGMWLLNVGYGVANDGFAGVKNFGMSYYDGVTSGSVMGYSGVQLTNAFQAGVKEVFTQPGDSGGPDFFLRHRLVDGIWQWVPEVKGVHSWGRGQRDGGLPRPDIQTGSFAITESVAAKIRGIIGTPRITTEIFIQVFDDGDGAAAGSGEWFFDVDVNGTPFSRWRNKAVDDPNSYSLGTWDWRYDGLNPRSGTLRVQCGGDGRLCYEEDSGYLDDNDPIPTMDVTVSIDLASLQYLPNRSREFEFGRTGGAQAYRIYGVTRWTT